MDPVFDGTWLTFAIVATTQQQLHWHGHFMPCACTLRCRIGYGRSAKRSCRRSSQIALMPLSSMRTRCPIWQPSATRPFDCIRQPLRHPAPAHEIPFSEARRYQRARRRSFPSGRSTVIPLSGAQAPPSSIHIDGSTGQMPATEERRIRMHSCPSSMDRGAALAKGLRAWK